MKILVDTNVIISAIAFSGRPRKLLLDLIDKGHSLIVTEYIIDEFREIVERKWPDKASRLIKLFMKMEFVFLESTNTKTQLSIRDDKDVQVLSDAVFYGADVILTGDKDFLESDIDKPMIFSVNMLDEFLKIGS